jgi:hypothetical protein
MRNLKGVYMGVYMGVGVTLVVLTAMIGVLKAESEYTNLRLEPSFKDVVLGTFPKGCDYKITSGRRSKAHNRRVGGAPKSMHLTGRALDVVVYTPRCRQAVVANASSRGLSVIKYNIHLHIDNRTKSVCLVSLGNNRYSPCNKEN